MVDSVAVPVEEAGVQAGAGRAEQLDLAAARVGHVQGAHVELCFVAAGDDRPAQGRTEELRRGRQVADHPGDMVQAGSRTSTAASRTSRSRLRTLASLVGKAGFPSFGEGGDRLGVVGGLAQHDLRAVLQFDLLLQGGAFH